MLETKRAAHGLVDFRGGAGGFFDLIQVGVGEDDWQPFRFIGGTQPVLGGLVGQLTSLGKIPGLEGEVDEGPVQLERAAADGEGARLGVELAGAARTTRAVAALALVAAGYWVADVRADAAGQRA